MGPIKGSKHGPKPSGWMTVAEVCSELGIVLTTLYRYIDQGKLPGYRVGRVIRLQRADVDAFLESSRLAPGALRHLQKKRY